MPLSSGRAVGSSPPPANQNDAPAALQPLEAAMGRFADGDDGAFVNVYRLAAPHLYRLLRRIGNEPAAADDLVQDTFLRVYRARSSYQRGAKVLPWVSTIARRLVIDRGRRRRQAQTIDRLYAAYQPAAGGPPRADEETAARRMAGAVTELLGRLPPSQALAFRLVREEGLSLSEAAARLGDSSMALRLRTHRACKAIREALQDHL